MTEKIDPEQRAFHILYHNQNELWLGNEFWAYAYSRLLAAIQKPAVAQLPEKEFEDLEIVQGRILIDEQLFSAMVPPQIPLLPRIDITLLIAKQALGHDRFRRHCQRSLQARPNNPVPPFLLNLVGTVDTGTTSTVNAICQTAVDLVSDAGMGEYGGLEAHSFLIMDEKSMVGRVGLALIDEHLHASFLKALGQIKVPKPRCGLVYLAPTESLELDVEMRQAGIDETTRKFKEHLRSRARKVIE
ncbi:hypothetical protein I310_03287 [Cryptococcus deuterogattii CA1014]|nr:hypothetical protein I310_03287 [Cryptococcus deuterogattii CA1014]